MYATLRQYAGVSPTVFDTLMGRKADIETLIRQVPGFVQYDLVRTADGMTTMTICNDKAGTEASNTQGGGMDWAEPADLADVRAGHHRRRGHPALHCLSTPWPRTLRGSNASVSGFGSGPFLFRATHGNRSPISKC